MSFVKFHHFTMSAAEVSVFGNIYTFKKTYRNGNSVFQCKEPKCESKIKVDENACVSRMTRKHNHKPHYLEREFFVCEETPIQQKKKKKNDSVTEEKPSCKDLKNSATEEKPTKIAADEEKPSCKDLKNSATEDHC